MFDFTLWKTFLPFTFRSKKHNQPDDVDDVGDNKEGYDDVERPYVLLSKSDPNGSNTGTGVDVETTTTMENNKNPDSHWKGIVSPDEHLRSKQGANADVKERYVGFGIGGAGNMRKLVLSPMHF